MLTNEKIEKLRDEILEEECLQYNKEAVLELLQEWCSNISQNIGLTRFSNKISDIPNAESEHCVVVGAAPELTDEEIIALKKYRGDIIITNKNYERFLKLGVFPDWVCLLDAHPVSLMQFKFLEKSGVPWSEETKFMVASVVHPDTLKLICDVTAEVYMFNPVSEDTGSAVRISKTWEWMNDAPEFEHGGSVGCLAVSLAKHLRYRVVGLLGFGLYERPNPKWTLEEAKQREFIYYPDTNENVALPLNFKAYITYITFEVKDSSWAKYYNMSNSPVLRHSPHLVQTDVKEFVKNSKKWVKEVIANELQQPNDERMGQENAKDA